MLGPPSLSVGRIEGGQSVNVVPDGCEIEVDRRLIPGEDEETAREVRGLPGDRLGDLDRVEFLPPFVDDAPALAGRDEPVLPGPRGDRPGPRPALPGRSASHTAPTPARSARPGLPSLVIGPGDIAQAHTKDEWVELDQVRLAVEVYFEIARELGYGSLAGSETTGPATSPGRGCPSRRAEADSEDVEHVVVAW